ncbi:GNAT family N-acetyltransferase [Microbacterium sp. AGC85]
MNNITFVRAASVQSGDIVNKFFESLGYDAPACTDHMDGHISAVLDGGTVRGAAYAAAAGTVADTLLLARQGVEGLALSAQVQSLDAIAVHPKYRGRGYGSILLESVAAHARRDFGARHLITRIRTDVPDLLNWFSDRGFQLCQPGRSLVVGGVPLMPTAGHLDAHMQLNGLPAFSS